MILSTVALSIMMQRYEKKLEWPNILGLYTSKNAKKTRASFSIILRQTTPRKKRNSSKKDSPFTIQPNRIIINRFRGESLSRRDSPSFTLLHTAPP
jgi:hypothetical protein